MRKKGFTPNDCAQKTIFAYNPVGVEEEENKEYRMSNVEFRLFQNHPNPFFHSTTIRYSLPAVRGQGSGVSEERKIPVRLVIYDLTGRLVESLVDEKQEPGIYQVQWDGRSSASGGLPVRSGIYFYRLQARFGQAGDFTTTKKLILLR